MDIPKPEFEWDPWKAASNIRKHGFDFRTGALAFSDSNHVKLTDGRKDYGEVRWKCLGRVGQQVLSVIYTLRGDEPHVIRIISVRRAGRYERRQYGEG